MILLRVDPAFGDKSETFCEGCYETKNIFIFTCFQFSMLDTIVGYAVWFANSLLIARHIT
jgi:hypothetical protein